jgi:pimeloyl-ACP methyl ester carboxylesterase
MSLSVTSLDGTRIAYTRDGSGAPIVLVDGALCHRGHGPMPALARVLAADAAVYTYDRRGRGESGDMPPYAVDREIEDVAAIVERAGAPVTLYGFSSGAILALLAAARLGRQVARLVVHEPPFNSGAADALRAMREFAAETARLIGAGRKADAVAFFLRDMVPAAVLDGMKQTPAWELMVAVAHTLPYDNAVLGDGSVPREIAASVTAPTLALVGSGSGSFKHAAVDALVRAMPDARRRTIVGHPTLVQPDVLAAVLVEFTTAPEPTGRT